MTIIEASKLGTAGAEILELLNELKDICNGGQDDLFEDDDHKKEWCETTIDMVVSNLTKLREDV